MTAWRPLLARFNWTLSLRSVAMRAAPHPAWCGAGQYGSPAQQVVGGGRTEPGLADQRAALRALPQRLVRQHTADRQSHASSAAGRAALVTAGVHGTAGFGIRCRSGGAQVCGQMRKSLVSRSARAMVPAQAGGVAGGREHGGDGRHWRASPAKRAAKTASCDTSFHW